ncbi:MAG: virulence protein RhuM/Fic/DOC family protein [Firmicutes bacterium]|nr:virulence protein RhuM/Fic/DOC family protein [Bacillota bacterium]MBQ6685570.1 virulence protein RhuM/Fic/DOC family protein [Bacillota bacterium]
MMSKNELVIFETEDSAVTLEVPVEQETVWLNQAQMTELFDVDRTVITRHVNNVFKEGELERESNVHFLHIANSDKPVQFYSLDVIISVGYRVKSKRGVEFRKWANSVLKKYILQGYAVNQNRIAQMGEIIQVMKRTQNSLDSKQVLSVIEKYSEALELLDSYDHQTMSRPEGNKETYRLNYEECMEVISHMRFGAESDLFGREKDDSFQGSIGNIYQSFGGQDLYPTLEEKAAHLLYFVTKNHSFLDGNKRIAATMFLYFLDKNGVLFINGEKLIDDHTLVALTIMIAESKPEEKEMMITVVMNCLK